MHENSTSFTRDECWDRSLVSLFTMMVVKSSNGFLERLLIPHACQYIRCIWIIPLIICFNFWLPETYLIIFEGLAQMNYYILDVHSLLCASPLKALQKLVFLHNLYNCACKFSCCRYAGNNKKNASSFLVLMCTCSDCTGKQVAQSRMKPGLCSKKKVTTVK